MISFSISPFLKSTEYALKLENFEPQDGYELFLQKLCTHLNEQLIDWYQGIESGIGHITYQGYRLTVFWTDFPFSLSFDCRDKDMAEKLQFCLEGYFRLNPES